MPSIHDVACEFGRIETIVVDDCEIVGGFGASLQV